MASSTLLGARDAIPKKSADVDFFAVSALDYSGLQTSATSTLNQIATALPARQLQLGPQLADDLHATDNTERSSLGSTRIPASLWIHLPGHGLSFHPLPPDVGMELLGAQLPYTSHPPPVQA